MRNFFVVLGVLATAFFGSRDTLHAKHKHATQVTMQRGGYTFLAQYKVHIHSANSPTEVILVVGSGRLTHSLLGPTSGDVFLGPFAVFMQSPTAHGEPINFEAWENNNRDIQITKNNIQPSSMLYQAAIRILKRAGHRFDIARSHKIILPATPHLSKNIHIASLDSSTLTRFYFLRIGPPHRNYTRRGRRLFKSKSIHVSSRLERVAKYGNRKVITTTVTYDRSDNHFSKKMRKIKFVKIKNKFKVLNCPRDTPSLLWPWIKKTAQENTSQYCKFHQYHKRHFSYASK